MNIQRKLVLVDHLFTIYYGNIIKITKNDLVRILNDFLNEEKIIHINEIINLTKKDVIKEIYSISNKHLIDLTGVPSLDYVKHYTSMISFMNIGDKGLLYKIFLLKVFAIHKYQHEKIIIDKVVKVSDLIEIKNLISQVDKIIIQIRELHKSVLKDQGLIIREDSSITDCAASSRPI